MPIDDAVREIYDSLVTEMDLEQLITDQVQEGLYLEFKKKTNASNGEMDDADKRQFSRALSGFGNSGGGVLLWGIEGDQAERATALRPIEDVLRFQAALKKSILNSTQPVVDEVEIDVIYASRSRSRGYIKCLISQSERTPHRAMLADREYFKRSTEGFYRLEHFDLEDMFGRRPVPRLDLTWRINKGISIGSWEGNKQDVDIHFTLVNTGRGSGRAPFVEMVVNQPYEIAPTGVSSGAEDAVFRWLRDSSVNAKFLGRSELIVHPDTGFEFAIVKRRFWNQESLAGDLTVTARLAAENGRIRERTLIFAVADLLHAVGWTERGPA